MKCLEKDRSRRYDTANGLAMDIRRHLENEPVSAKPGAPSLEEIAAVEAKDTPETKQR